MRHLVFRCVALALLLCAGWELRAADVIDLAGQWRFALDRQNEGIQKRWFTRELPQTIQLPGMLQAQGYGDVPSAETPWLIGPGRKRMNDPIFEPYLKGKKFLSPFFLTPPRYYTGQAWYQREIQIPESWKNRRVELFLERPHWVTTVWIDDKEVGSCDSLATPHVYDLTKVISPGTHTLTICVDNRYLIPVGHAAHSVSDETQGNWNGIVGRIELRATPLVWIDDLQVYPNAAKKMVKTQVSIGNHTGQSGGGQLVIWATLLYKNRKAETQARAFPVSWESAGATVKIDYELGDDALLWDEFQPAVYVLHARLCPLDKNLGEHQRDVYFGLRDIEIRGTQFVVNGRPIFLRGTLECCIFPLTGHPPTDVESWRRILSRAKEFGLNHIRFHSWCPPEAAFIAADQLGFYYQVECSCWASFGAGTPVDDFVYREAERIRRFYGNHPSFLMMAASNEPGGRNSRQFLGNWVQTQRKADPRHFYTAGSGWPQIDQNDYHVQPTTRLQRWEPLRLDRPPQTWDDYRDYIEQLGKPTVSHEIGQWCVYPNVVDEPEKYTGYFIPSNLLVYRDILQKKGLAHMARRFLIESGRFQLLLYKQEIESALRTPGMAGFQLLDLHDFPGQGTAPVGVLDALWDPKPYVTAEQYSSFCNCVVPLARMKKLTWTVSEVFVAQIDVANYGPTDLRQTAVRWKLSSGTDTVAEGTLRADCPTGKLTTVGTIRVPLTRVSPPCKLTLQAQLEGTSFCNNWNIWVYPDKVDLSVPQGVLVVKDPEEAWKAAENGGRVLLLVPAHYIRGETVGSFQPIFWNRVTFPSQRIHMLGIVCRSDHPSLRHFPTETHANWQWEDLLDHCKPMILDELPKTINPIIQPIDDWCLARKLALLFEAAAGKGGVLVCSIDLQEDLENRPVARQLLYSLLRYVGSADFKPQSRLTKEQWQKLYREPTLLERVGVEVRADSFERGFEPQKAVDGNENSIWHTRWTPAPSQHPHWLIVKLGKPLTVKALRLLPRQDGNPNGKIAECLVYCSTDGQSWGEPVARGKFPESSAWQTISFPTAVTTRWLKLEITREVRGQPFASLAELDLVVEPTP